jgi:UDP-3-O-[3-hydroxymyristoyl] glucosamine N-acyltransferase
VQTTVEELAALVGGHVVGGTGREPITGVASVSDAIKGDITFFGNAKYLPALRSSLATCALVPEGFTENIAPIQIQVEKPSLAFSQVVGLFAPAPVEFPAGIHPSAVISPEARLGKNVSIQAHVVVEPGAEIGEGTFLGANAYIGHNTRIGTGCKIYPNVSIRERCVLGNRVIVHCGAVIGGDGFGFEMNNGHWVKIPQIGIVQIDDDVEIGANTTIDRARFGRTWIGEGTKVDNLVQIAHNVVVGKHSILVSQVGVSGSSRIGNYATLAGQVGVVGHIEIGDQAIVAAKSGVSKSVPAKQMWWGSPAAPIHEQKERVAHMNRLPKLIERVKRLEERLDGKE